MAIGKTLQSIEAADFEGGVNYNKDITALEGNESPNAMNIVFGDTVKKRPGYKEMYVTSVGATSVGYSLADFGVADIGRKLVTHVGNKVYKQDGLDGTMDTILSAAPLSTSFNSIVKQNLIQTYDNYSTEYYWNGTASIMAQLSASSPGFKHTVEHQGYLLGGNISTNKLRIYYEDINTMIGGSYADYFTLTGGQDDQLEGFFLINGRLYAGTSSAIFRISFIGGLAVFEYKNVISDVGIVPRTIQVVITKKFGQVALFLGTDKNMYLFDGSSIQNISEKYRFPNNDTDVCLEYIDDNYIRNSHSVYDTIKQVYRLFVTLKGDTTNTIAMNINVETLAYYPFDNMKFASSTMARDNLGRWYLVGADYVGKLHWVFRDFNSDNGKAILELYESPLIKSQDPNKKKASTIDLHFLPVANYTTRYYDRTDYDKTWKVRSDVEMFQNRDKFLGGNTALGTTFKLGSDNSVIVQSINLPIMENAYRFKLATIGADADSDCYYLVGTVAGTGATTTITGTGTTWTTAMTVANGYRIHIKDGNHANTTYTFEYVSATSATVGTMAAGNFTGASYEIYRTDCAPCQKGWELLKLDYNTQLLSVGRTEVQR